MVAPLPAIVTEIVAEMITFGLGNLRKQALSWPQMQHCPTSVSQNAIWAHDQSGLKVQLLQAGASTSRV
jgi:hypothetical protein